MPTLPPPRTPGRYAISLVCLGNICRSPTAHVVLEARLAAAGLDDRVSVRSSGTGDWHVGRPMDSRAAATLEADGYDASRHRARQYDDSWAAEDDLVLAMDHDNLADLGGRTDRVGDVPRLRPGRCRRATCPTPTTAAPTASATCSRSSSAPRTHSSSPCVAASTLA